mgnify:FL=1
MTELKEAILADYILRLKNLPREKLIHELIEFKSRELKLSDDQQALKNKYGKQKTKK